jgi:hypothetical protein
MYTYYAVAFFVALIFGLVVTNIQNTSNIQTNVQCIALARNIEDYGTAVSNWAQSNTSFTGTVSDATLALPSWIWHRSNVSNYVATGTSYIYVTTPQGCNNDNLVSALTAKGIRGGFVKTGQYYKGITANGTVPGSVPNGSVVIIL